MKFVSKPTAEDLKAAHKMRYPSWITNFSPKLEPIFQQAIAEYGVDYLKIEKVPGDYGTQFLPTDYSLHCTDYTKRHDLGDFHQLVQDLIKSKKI